MAAKITPQVHAAVTESLKTMGVFTTATYYGLSVKTIQRIKRGRSFAGYKRQLAADHVSLAEEIWGKPSSVVPTLLEEIGINHPKSFVKRTFERMRRRR